MIVLGYSGLDASVDYARRDPDLRPGEERMVQGLDSAAARALLARGSGDDPEGSRADVLRTPLHRHPHSGPDREFSSRYQTRRASPACLDDALRPENDQSTVLDCFRSDDRQQRPRPTKSQS